MNRYSGGLTYVHPDAAMTGERMPVSLAHTYVSNHVHNQGNNWNMKLGVGFRLSLFEEILPLNCYESTSGTLIESDDWWENLRIGLQEWFRNAGEMISDLFAGQNFPNDWSITPEDLELPDYYTLVDGDGTEHRFIKTKHSTPNFESEINDKILLEPAENNTLIMKDEYGNQKIYERLRREEIGNREYYYHVLTKIKDTNGNEINIIYDRDLGRITEIIDTVGRTIKLNYAGDYLDSITDPTGKVTTFTYDTADDVLTKITYFDDTPADPKATEFTYSKFKDNNETAWQRTQLSIVTTPGGHQYGFSYGKVNSSGSTGYRVDEIQHGIDGGVAAYTPEEGGPSEKSELWQEKSQIASGFADLVAPAWTPIAQNVILPVLRLFNPRWTYQADTMWFSLPPDIPDDDNEPVKLEFTDATDIETISFKFGHNQIKITNSLQKEAAVSYVFDNMGRAVGAKDESSGSSAFIGYTQDGGVQNLPGYTAGAANVENLLPNIGWSGGQVYEGPEAYTGRARILTEGATLSQAASVTGGETYTISLFARAWSGSANATLQYGSSSMALELTDEWERYTATFDAGGSSAIIAVTANGGEVLVDAVQLEKNASASPFNFVENSHFRDKNSTLWTVSGDDLDGHPSKYDVNSKTEAPFYQLGGNLKEKVLMQVIPLNGKKGETIVFGASAKVAATSDNCYVHAEFFNGSASISIEDDEQDEKDRKASFNRDVIVEQGTATSYVLPADCTEMRFYIHNDNQINDMEVYYAFAFKGVGGTKYVYEGGKIKQVTSRAGTATYSYYDDYSNKNLRSIEVRRPGETEPSETVEYTYDTRNNVAKAVEKKKDIETNTNTVIGETYYNYRGPTELTHSYVGNQMTNASIGGILTGSASITYTEGANAQKLAGTQTITYLDNTCNEVEKAEDGNGNWIQYTYKTCANGIIDNTVVMKSEASDGSEYTYSYDDRDLLTSILGSSGVMDYENEYGYTTRGSDTVVDALKTISHNGTTYTFGYNALGQVQKTSIGGQVIAENTYFDDENTSENAPHKRFSLEKTRYGNDFYYEPRYNDKGLVVGEVYYKGAQNASGQANYEYTYGRDGTLSKILNREAEQETQLGYDMTGRLTEAYTRSTGSPGESTRTRLSYDEDGAMVDFYVLLNGSSFTRMGYAYDKLGRPTETTFTTLGGSKLAYTYSEETNRLLNTSSELNGGQAVTSYGYSDTPQTIMLGGQATNVLMAGNVTSMTNDLPGTANDKTYTYTYQPGGGNITSISETGAATHTYTYDKIGQLTSDSGTTYAYDAGGNLTHINGVNRFAYGNPEWKDQLTAFDGNPLTYDEIGNLTSYNGRAYTWQKTSQLAGIEGSGLSASYKYDYTGLRSEKTVNGVTTRYIWAGGLLMGQVGGGNTIAWSYDSAGSMVGFSLNGVPYFYLRNLQGDVVGIYDADGSVVASYTYDAWGNILSATGTLAQVNPIRYRGYYWDAETGYYYCQSRYYNPQWCRWISGDVHCDTGTSIIGTNIYAYCDNDPVNFVDPSGFAPDLSWMMGAARWAKDFGLQFSGMSLLMAQQHLAYNRKIEENYGIVPYMIFNQSTDSYGKMQFGTRDIWYNGCGLIAIYNAMSFLGKPKPMSQIIYDFEKDIINGTWAAGEFGTWFFRVGDYLRGQGFDVKSYSSAKKMDKAMTDGRFDGYIIMYYWTSKNAPYFQMHFTFAINHPDYLIVVNENGMKHYDSVQAYMKKEGHYITGWRVRNM